CGSGEFQCDNGKCIRKNLYCDGDFACVDGSDETRCECPSNMFLCPSGECIMGTQLCDGKKDCTDNTDEKNCGK
ncbi:predicted protein, partial [Nematostella vectensis]